MHTTTTVRQKLKFRLGLVTSTLKIVKLLKLSKSISSLAENHPVSRSIPGTGQPACDKKTVHKIDGTGGVCGARSTERLRPNITPEEQCWGACVPRVRRPDTVREIVKGEVSPIVWYLQEYKEETKETTKVWEVGTHYCDIPTQYWGPPTHTEYTQNRLSAFTAACSNLRSNRTTVKEKDWNLSSLRDNRLSADLYPCGVTESKSTAACFNLRFNRATVRKRDLKRVQYHY